VRLSRVWERPLDAEVRAAYLERLGLDAEPPSADAVRRLMQRHVERVPYETMWIKAGERWGIDPADSARRVAIDRRGGYCYHLNGALGALLRSLGYTVTGHVGGVHGAGGPAFEEIGNHLVLTLSGLPSGDNPSGIWYVDAGLGDALHEPLPLAAGEYEQQPFRISLEEVDRGWHLTHDPAGGFTGMTWTTGSGTVADNPNRYRPHHPNPGRDLVQTRQTVSRNSRAVSRVPSDDRARGT